jgi:hypothetical protein
MIAITRVRSLCKIAFCLALLCVVVARANAGVITSGNTPTFTMQAGGAPDAWTWTPGVNAFDATADGYQLHSIYEKAGVCDGTANVKVDLLKFNPDPFILNNVLITNTTATTQTYTVTTNLPTTFGAPNNISGTITTSVIDGDASGSATIAALPGGSIYKAQIDSNTVQTMQNAPFSLTTSTSTASTANFGPIVSAVPVNTSIGVQLTFTLTAGDTAAILSRFDVTAVPEPTSAACIGTMLVLTGGAFSRRRRQA